jgi:hypothetical protein|tara:strand:- start:495 stop:722 length:228 start_codon:yes stop_codon:yes gene_type:complete
MSINIIITKVLDSIKEELKKEENIKKLKYDILKPIIEEVLYIMYPYFAFISCIFIIVILVIFLILFLNIKICYSK